MKSFYAFTIIATSILLSSCTSEAPQAKIEVTPAASHKPREVIKLDRQEERQIQLRTTTVNLCVLPETIEFPGQIQPDANLTTPVISLMPGRIEAVRVLLGDRVKKGEILAEIRSDAVAQVESDLLREILNLETDENSATVELKLASILYERKKQLFKDGIAAKSDVDIAERDLQHHTTVLDSIKQKRQTAIRIAGERLRLFGVLPLEIERLLKDRTIDNTFEIVAPRNGIVTERNADTGQLIDNSHGLFVVSDLSTVWVMSQIFEKDIAKIKIGTPATVTIDSYPNKIFTGKIDYITQNLDEETRTMAARISLKNTDLLLKPNMFARITARVGNRTVIAIPKEAVQKIGETNLVYIQETADTFREQKVTLGQHSDGLIEIKSGLKSGQQVVTTGSLQLLGEALQGIQD